MAHDHAIGARIERLFEQARCDGQLCLQPEAETQFADGRLDPRGRVTLTAAQRTPGTVGFLLFRDDVEALLRDLVAAMLTISDNPATDAVLHRVSLDAVNASSARLGLADTVITADLRTMINSIGTDMGFANWAAMSARAAQPHTPAQEDQIARRMRATTALTPSRAAGFGPPARVAAKSGGLVGVIRNEIGVIEYPDGRGYAAAVFTQARQPGQGAAIDAVIGTAAATAVSVLPG